MPRTLPAELTAALNSGSFTPYFLLTVKEVGASILETVQPVQFKLSGINLTAKWVDLAGDTYTGFSYPQDFEFKVTRGVTIAGVNYTINSSYYYGTSEYWDGIFQYITACMLPETKYTAAGDDTYENVITDLCTAFGKTAVFDDPTADWLQYQFLGAGKVLTLNRANGVLNMLKQKYIIFACDNGGDEILFRAIATDPAGATDHTLTLQKLKSFSGDVAPKRRFLYRDEVNTVHYAGATTDPLWNLGYLESTASAPGIFSSLDFEVEAIAPHLKYLSFDRFKFTLEKYPTHGILDTVQGNMQVEEEFDYELKEIPWRIYVRSYNWAKGTEGGAMPGTIEAAAPYTPLNTSNFDGILDANDNNIQAAMESIDDHTHTAADIGVREQLTAARTYYVRTDGSDSNNGLANTAGGAFLTVQKAVDVVATLDTSLYDVTIQVADGTYVTSWVILKNPLGSGTVTIKGNSGTPANVVIDGGFEKLSTGITFIVKDLKVINATSSNAIGFYCINGAAITLSNINFSTGFVFHVLAAFEGVVRIETPVTISGGANVHVYASTNAVVYFESVAYTLTGTPAFSTAFCVAEHTGVAQGGASTFSGSATGSRYSVTTNAAILVAGGGANFFPGNAAGSTATGGQYV